jgi:hypothetical protein
VFDAFCFFLFNCSDLSNNSFYGVIPREIGELKQLVVLDLRNNSLSGTLPSDLDNIFSLKLL